MYLAISIQGSASRDGVPVFAWHHAFMVWKLCMSCLTSGTFEKQHQTAPDAKAKTV